MKSKILSLMPDEEVRVVGHNCKKLLKIKNSQKELNVKEIDDIEGKSTMEVTTFGYDDLKQYVMFEMYYQYIMEEDSLPNDIKDYINKIMIYHENKIYDKSGAELDAKGYDYQCILYY